MNKVSSVRPAHTIRVFNALILSYLMIVMPFAPVAAATRQRSEVRSQRSGLKQKAEAQPGTAKATAEDLFVNAPAVTPVLGITATKRDAYPSNPSGKAAPGDTITYTVDVNNPTANDATGVSFTDMIDAGTTRFGADFDLKISPIAINDTYSVQKNSSLAAPAAAGVLVNDTGLPTPTVSAVTGTAPCVVGSPCATTNGNVTLNADGSFAYTPTTGFTGTDTFTYAISNGNASPVPGTDDTATVTFNVDAAPSVTSTTPANSAIDQATNINLTVTFSEAVNVTANWFQIVCTSSGTHNVADTVVTGGPTTFTINPNTDFTQAESCTVTIDKTKVSDQDTNDPPDNMLADYAFSFTMDAAPSVQSTTPANGATSVASNSDVTVTFTEAVTTAAGAFTISCGSSGAHTFVQTGGPTTFTLNPGVDFTQGETCTVTVVAANVTDNDANDPPNNMLANYVFSFTVDAAPSVSTTSPANGATGVPVNTNIVVNFSESVDVTTSSFTIECPAPGNLQTFSVTGTGNNSITLDPTADLPAGVTCTVTVVANQVADSDTADPPNNMLANYVFSFTTDAAPAVSTTTPANGATQVANNANVTVNFSESVNATTSSFTISCATSGSHTFTIGSSPALSFVLNPDADFTNGEVCTVTVIANQITDADANDPPDNMSANYVFSFTVDVPPSVSATTPTNSSLSNLKATNITTTFSEAVNVTGNWFQIVCTVSGTRNVSDTAVTGGPTTFTINPTTDFTAGETCTVTVFAAQVADQDTGDPPDNMTSDYVFSFGVAPDAIADNYNATGNIGIVVPVTGAQNGVLFNDVGTGRVVNFVGATTATTAVPNGGSAGSATGQGGAVTMNSDGSFTYVPKAGQASGTDTFKYKIVNSGGQSNEGTVTITITGIVWFICDGCAGSSQGTLQNPFTSIAAFTSANNVGSASGANQPADGQRVFIETSNSASADGVYNLSNDNLALRANQIVSGQGQAATSFFTPEAPAPAAYGALTATTRPTIAPTTSNAVTVNSGNTISNFNIGNSSSNTGAKLLTGPTTGNWSLTASNMSVVGRGTALDLSTDAGNAVTLSATFDAVGSSNSTGAGVSLTRVGGTLTINNVGSASAFNNVSGDDFFVNAGNAAISYAGTITNTAAHSVNIANMTGGSVTFSGAISDTGTGLVMANNTGATMTYSGGITARTGASNAFSATGGGTVNVTGTNTLKTTGGTALTITSTTIGASNVTFQCISAGRGDTGGTACNQGAASGSPANGIVLSGTGNTGTFTVTGDGTTTGSVLNRNGSGGLITNTTDDGVRLTNTNNVTLKQMDFTNCGDTATGLATDNESTSGEHAVEMNTGSNIILSAVTLTGGATTPVIALELSGTSRINEGSLFTAVNSASSHAFFLKNATTSNTLFEINDTDFKDSTSPASTVFATNGPGSANVNFDIVNGCLFQNLNSQAVTITPGADIGSYTGTFTSNVKNNTFKDAAVVGGFPAENNLAVLVANHALHVATVEGNTFDNIAEDGSIANTSIIRTQNAAGRITANIKNNLIQNISYPTGGRHVIGHVFEPSAGAYSASDFSNITIDGNTVSNVTYASTNREFAFVDYRAEASGGYVKIINNNWNMPSVGAQQAIELRFRQNNASTVPVLINNNGNGTGATFNTTGVYLDIDSEVSNTIPVTVTNNNFNNSGTTASAGLDFATEAAGSNMCVNVSGNTVPTATDRIRLTETAGKMTVTQASSAAVSSANGGAAVVITGSPTFGQPACTTPPLLLGVGGIESASDSAASFASFAFTPLRRCDSVVSRSILSQPRVASIATSQLNEVVSAAMARWIESGLTPQQIAEMRSLKFELSDLPQGYLGEAANNAILVDRSAQGKGWYIDATPNDDAEFGTTTSATRRYTNRMSAPAGHVDLLTALEHEIGHKLGLPDSYLEKDRDSIMYGYLTMGERRVPRAGEARAAQPGNLTTPHFLKLETAEGSKPKAEGRNNHGRNSKLETRNLRLATAAAPLSGETLGPVSIGTIPAGKHVRITFKVTIDLSFTGANVSNQGTVSGTLNATPFNVSTDDPDTGTAGDATLTPVLGPANANDDNYTAFKDNTLNVPAPGVLGNDTNATSVSAGTGTAPCVLATPCATTNGSVTLNSDGSFSYTPTAGYTGSDSFTYVATGNGTDTATVNITVVNTSAIYINEVLFNPPGTDAPNEYIELRGLASSTIPAGTYLVAIAGDAGSNPGDVTRVIDLGGLAFGSNGYLVLLQMSNTYVTAAGATVVTSTSAGFGGLPSSRWSADAAATDLPDASTTFMLIQTGTPPALTNDIDANDDGAFDGTVYPGWSVRDSISAMNGSALARAYGAFSFRNQSGTGTGQGGEVIVPFIPSYVGRICDSTGSASSDWASSGVLGGSAPNWTLGSNLETQPPGFAGLPLDHIGATNFANSAPVNSVPGSTQSVNEDGTLTFNSGNSNLISIADSDAGSNNVQVSLSVSNGTLSLSGISGLSFSFSDGNGTGAGDGVSDAAMTFRGSLTDVNTALNGMSYTPTANYNGSDSLGITTNDLGSSACGSALTDTDTVNITVNGVNDAPVLDNAGNMSLTTVPPNPATNSGDLVSAIIASAGGDRITDADAGAVEGIAVTAVDNTNGTWEYSTNNGGVWTAFGTPSATVARLLASDANTRVRFLPGVAFTGTVNPGITFRAWDQTSGTNGTTANPSTNGGTTAFSTATETASITVSAATSVSVADASKAEPTSGSADMVFTVSLNAPAAGTVTVDFTTQDEPAGPGKAVAGSDYSTTTGTVTFTSGQQVKTINVPILSDGNNSEPDETFLVQLSNASGVTISDGTATGTIKATNPAGTFIISELRTSGPGGATDEFVELYNNTDQPHTVAASDASAGYGLFKMGTDCNATPVLIGTVPNGTVIPARGHYLLVGSAYSLANYGGTGAAAGNQTLSSDIENDRNVAIFSTANITLISSINLLDAVGFGTNTGGVCDLMREGSTLPPASGSVLEYSFFRKLLTGTPQDTNANSTDFMFADTQGTVTPMGQRLGAPGPENLASPIKRDPSISVLLLDTSIASSGVPNRFRDPTPNTPSPTVGAYGTLSFRRRVVNSTGASVTRLRFRIIDITTLPYGPGDAELHAITSVNASVTNVNDSATCFAANGSASTPCTVTVKGTTLETPPTQNIGGGYNSTLADGTITLGTPLANGASSLVQFQVGVMNPGHFRFFIIVEALP